MLMSKQCNRKLRRRTKGKVKGLRREVSDNVGGVPSPQRDDALFFDGTTESIDYAFVWSCKPTLLDLWT